MTQNELLQALNSQPETIDFADVMSVVADNYDYTATAFKNGELQNEAGQNEGSCKLFAFAKLNQLDADQTLALFGAYYRDDVLGKPEGTDHGNIRNFMKTGWDGVVFSAEALAKKS